MRDKRLRFCAFYFLRWLCYQCSSGPVRLSMLQCNT